MRAEPFRAGLAGLDVDDQAEDADCAGRGTGFLETTLSTLVIIFGGGFFFFMARSEGVVAGADMVGIDVRNVGK